MSTNQARFPITTQCRLLGVSASGYYAWSARSPSARAQSDAVLTQKIRTNHLASVGTYGVPRIHAELLDDGIHVGRKRVARLMRLAGIKGVSRRKFVTTTTSDGSRQAPDLVQRKFQADKPNQLWVADITYVPTSWRSRVSQGRLALSIWRLFWMLFRDALLAGRRVENARGTMATTLHRQVVLDALDMATKTRKPQNVIHHSDQGSQYTSIDLGKRCHEADVKPSMGSVGDCYDNASL